VGGDQTIPSQQRQFQLKATRGERITGVVLALFAAAAFLLIGGSLVPLGLLLALALLSAASMGNRAAMACASFLMVFGPWSAYFVLAAFHIGFAAFLVWRANRLDSTV
jgi:hypothetical protein